MQFRTPFQGDFLVRVVPRAEALGCFQFARRALGTRTRKCPNSSPGTSCLATIVLSLRDKSHSPIEAPHNYSPSGPKTNLVLPLPLSPNVQTAGRQSETLLL